MRADKRFFGCPLGRTVTPVIVAQQSLRVVSPPFFIDNRRYVESQSVPFDSLNGTSARDWCFSLNRAQMIGRFQ
jgi:hypothetical protein